ncbi:MAG: pyrophosphohydrolase [Actinotalea sp.]|nr:pyrophosphohydrolase [Actinotalea sp.]
MTRPVAERSIGAALARDLEVWQPVGARQELLRREYLHFIREHGAAATDRDAGPEHITASCFVLTPDLTHVLLCFHRKGRFWVQLGGHVEPADPSVEAAALREAIEEGGISALAPTTPVLLDLDRHGLGDAFGACRVHWDVGHGAIAAADAVPAVSAESDDVAWWPVDALPDAVPDGFRTRLRTVLAELRHHRASADRRPDVLRATVE